MSTMAPRGIEGIHFVTAGCIMQVESRRVRRLAICQRWSVMKTIIRGVPLRGDRAAMRRAHLTKGGGSRLPSFVRDAGGPWTVIGGTDLAHAPGRDLHGVGRLGRL